MFTRIREFVVREVYSKIGIKELVAIGLKKGGGFLGGSLGALPRRPRICD